MLLAEKLSAIPKLPDTALSIPLPMTCNTIHLQQTREADQADWLIANIDQLAPAGARALAVRTCAHVGLSHPAQFGMLVC